MLRNARSAVLEASGHKAEFFSALLEHFPTKLNHLTGMILPQG
jgi:hypothetical protein